MNSFISQKHSVMNRFDLFRLETRFSCDPSCEPVNQISYWCSYLINPVSSLSAWWRRCVSWTVCVRRTPRWSTGRSRALRRSSAGSARTCRSPECCCPSLSSTSTMVCVCVCARPPPHISLSPNHTRIHAHKFSLQLDSLLLKKIEF